MWCPSCRADVAAELSTDNRRMLCTRCQSELGLAATAILQNSKMSATVEMERDARDLLSRWSSQSLLDPPLPATSVFTQVVNSTPTPIQKSADNPASPTSQALRSETPPPGPLREPQSAAPSLAIQTRTESTSTPQEPIPHRTVVPERNPDQLPEQSSRSLAHAPALQAPASPPVKTKHGTQTGNHDIPVGTTRRAPGLSTFLGQICAYAGVVLLTVGSVLVMWSFFGGPANYMPTGWLTAAVGQMLLFLGVVTLISSGMEQTIAEVTWRIDHLAEEIHHMGLALDELEEEHRIARIGPQTSTGNHSENDFARRAA
jgi:hypothetical protein